MIKEQICINKKCSECCDPIKVSRFFSEDKIPINEKGEKIWEYRGLLASAEVPDGIKLKAYKCKNFDKETGLCKDYEKRPKICRETICDEENIKNSGTSQKASDNNKYIQINAK
ncbi:MAG: YkgJ family cysteine cluster protein [Candidatus Parcubacteria bacterium]|nr:YkgJ family cysteine cluster protein [Candidatus Parcubacteria bacterium]